MKALEIILITLFVMVGFLGAEFIVSHIGVSGAFQRFLLRVSIQIQYILLIYLLFDSRESIRRIHTLEVNLENLKREKTENLYSSESRENVVPEGR